MDKASLVADPRWPEKLPVDFIVEELFVDATSASGLRWHTPKSGRKKDLTAGCLNKDTGYWAVWLAPSKRLYPCHKLVLLLSGIFPEEGQVHVDHIDRDPTNNKVENLRWTTVSENMRNRGNYEEKKLVAIKYAVWSTPFKKYLSNYYHPYSHELIEVGYYADPYEAHIAAVAHRLENCWYAHSYVDFD